MGSRELEEAVRSYKGGNRPAFAFIYEKSVDPLTGYAGYLTKDSQMTEDLVQDTYVRIMEKIGTLKDDSLFMPWARSIMYNLAVCSFRKRAREFSCEDAALQLFTEDQDPENDPEVCCEKEEARSMIDEAVSSLTEKQRYVIRKYYYESRPVRWIAMASRSSESTVKTRLFYARTSLRRSLSESMYKVM